MVKKDYAEFWRANKVCCGNCGNGELFSYKVACCCFSYIFTVVKLCYSNDRCKESQYLNCHDSCLFFFYVSNWYFNNLPLKVYYLLNEQCFSMTLIAGGILISVYLHNYRNKAAWIFSFSDLQTSIYLAFKPIRPQIHELSCV